MDQITINRNELRQLVVSEIERVYAQWHKENSNRWGCLYDYAEDGMQWEWEITLRRDGETYKLWEADRNGGLPRPRKFRTSGYYGEGDSTEGGIDECIDQDFYEETEFTLDRVVTVTVPHIRVREALHQVPFTHEKTHGHTEDDQTKVAKRAISNRTFNEFLDQWEVNQYGVKAADLVEDYKKFLMAPVI